MRIIGTSEASFEAFFRRTRERGRVADPALWEAVGRIVDDVADRGDAALFEYTARWDGHLPTAATVEATPAERRAAAARVAPADLEILRLAAARITRFHERQRQEGWTLADEPGVTLGQRLVPLARVGIYAPGGQACYPSTVLMTAIPARVAGVGEIVLVSPCRQGALSSLIAAAAELGGVDRVFKIGGAQAVAALAYGTASVPAVDKIVGPGNAWVATAKQRVFGRVDIDMIAGPSEILIIADGTGDPEWAAADLLGQAEHDELASALLLTPDAAYGAAVAAAVKRQLAALARRGIASQALADYGAVIVTRDLDEAVALANHFAPEHLELMVAAPEALLAGIRSAGAVFLGMHTPETLGDYLAGPNHVLPTGGTARFASPLGVYDFVKRMSVLSFSPEALARYGPAAARFAELEGLGGHGVAVTRRLAGGKG